MTSNAADLNLDRPISELPCVSEPMSQSGLVQATVMNDTSAKYMAKALPLRRPCRDEARHHQVLDPPKSQVFWRCGLLTSSRKERGQFNGSPCSDAHSSKRRLRSCPESFRTAFHHATALGFTAWHINILEHPRLFSTSLAGYRMRDLGPGQTTGVPGAGIPRRGD